MLTRWNHYRPRTFSHFTPFERVDRFDQRLLAQVAREFARAFDTTESRGESANGLVFKQTENALQGRMNVPGLSEKDIEITLDHDVLNLSLARPTEVPEGYTAHRRERRSYTWAQSYSLPYAIDAERTVATVVNGVLELTLSKAAEVEPTRILVNGE